MTETLHRLVERAVSSSGGPTFRVDKDRGIIFGARIAGLSSQNGYRYSESAMQAATRLCDGLAIVVGHPKDGRPRMDIPPDQRVGWVENPVFVPGKGIYGDLHVVRSHGFGQQALEVAGRNPSRLGASWEADGRFNRDETVVESVPHISCLALVLNPATVGGLKEGRSMRRRLREFATAADRAAYLRGGAVPLREQGQAAPTQQPGALLNYLRGCGRLPGAK